MAGPELNRTRVDPVVAHRTADECLLTPAGAIPERRTSADRLKAALRDNPADAEFADDLERAHGLDDAAIAAITAMELLVGVERADTAQRQARAVRVVAILSSLPIEPYNVGIARVHARLAVAATAAGRRDPQTT
jgi:predicted nucleic acid-binding protein